MRCLNVEDVRKHEFFSITKFRHLLKHGRSQTINKKSHTGGQRDNTKIKAPAMLLSHQIKSSLSSNALQSSAHSPGNQDYRICPALSWGGGGVSP